MGGNIILPTTGALEFILNTKVKLAAVIIMLTSPLFYTEFFVHMKYKTDISDWQAILQQAVLVI